MGNSENRHLSEQEKTAPQSIDKITQKGPEKKAPPRERKQEIKMKSQQGIGPQIRNPHEKK